MSSKTPLPRMHLRVRDKESQKHPGRPDQPQPRRSSQQVQVEKAKKISKQAEREDIRAHNIQAAAEVESQMEEQLQKKLASAHHPAPSTQKKVLRTRIKAQPLVPTTPSKARDDIPENMEGDVAHVQDVSSDSGDEYDPACDKTAEDKDEEEEEEEDALDESSDSEPERSDVAKVKKKAGRRGQLRKAVRSAQGKHIPNLGAKRKAGDRDRQDNHTAHPSKKAKRASSGLHDDWVQRSWIEAQPEGELGDIQVPCDDLAKDLAVADTHVTPHSPSSGKSFSSSSRPQTSLPDSDDDCEGGIADDAGERAERSRLSGKPLRPEILRNRNNGGGSKPAVHSLARIVPTTSVPTFIKPSISSNVAQIRLKKGDIRLSDLPAHLQSRFICEFTPRLYELFGTHTAWDQPKLDELQKLWRSIFPTERNLDSQSSEGVIALKLIDDRLSQWRKKFGERALEALEEITFSDLPTNDTAHREWWCEWALSGDDDTCQPFYYSTYDEPDEGPVKIKGIFQSPLIAAVLGTQMSWLSAINESLRSDKKPIGALVHSIQAAKRAILWWQTGEMVKPAKPLNEYSKANWGDHIEIREGSTIRINSTSNLVAIVSRLKEKQWEKILISARASGKVKKKMMRTVSESPEPSEVTLVELRDDDSDLMDDSPED